MKLIGLVSSSITSACVELLGGVKQVTVTGVGVDNDGHEYPVSNLVIAWEDLPQNVQNTGDNFFKHLSREFNNMVANEDVETW